MFEIQDLLLPEPSNILTTTNQNKPSTRPSKPKNPQLTSYPSVVNFGDCLPGQINQIDVYVNIQPWRSEIIVLHAKCDCINEEFNDLPQYIFALTKNNSDQYSQQVRVKANGESTVNFTVAMKAPEIEGFIAGIIVVRILASNVQPLKIFIKSNIVIPKIICIKQLTFEDIRTTRIIIKTQKLTRKEERKITFKNNSQMQMSVETQIISLQESDIIDCAPRNLAIASSSLFNIIISIRLPEGMMNYVKSLKENYTIRRILLIKSKTSSVIIHFPIQIILVYSEMKQLNE